MAVYTVAQEATSPVVPKRLFKALVLERHVIMPLLQPEVFKSCEFVEGSGGVGSIRKTTFVDGHPYKYMMHRIDELDEERMFCKYTLFESDVLRDQMESVVYEVKYDAEGDGSKGKMAVHYHPKPGCSVNEDEVKIGQEKAREFFKTAEAYLIANPDAYA